MISPPRQIVISRSRASREATSDDESDREHLPYSDSFTHTECRIS
jgi:hypothetical protein